MIITTERLQYLWAVAETGSFSAAGRKLGISGAAVQQAIQGFEFDLEATLFERHAGKKPELTLLGKQIYLQALDLLPKLQGIEKYALAVSQGQEPQLRIALHGMVMFPRFTQALVELQRHFPTLDLVLLDAENAVLSSDQTRLANQPSVDEADITLALGRLRSDHGGNSVIVERIRWKIVAASHHPLSQIRGLLSEDDLLQHTQLFPLPGLNSPADLIEGLRLSSHLVHYNRFYQLRELLLAGMGFAFFPAQLSEPLAAQGLIRELALDFDDDGMNWPIELCWVNGLGQAGQWLIERLTEE